MLNHSVASPRPSRLLQLGLLLTALACAGPVHAFASNAFGGVGIPAFGSAVEGLIENGPGCDGPPVVGPVTPENYLQNLYGFGTFLAATCYHDFASVSVNGSVGGAGSSSARADLALGYVEANASAASLSAGASAVIWNTLTFSGVTPGNDVVTVTMQGSAVASGQTRLYVVSLLAPFSFGTNPMYLLNNGNLELTGGDPRIRYDGSTYSFIQEFQVQNDVPMLFAVGVAAITAHSGSSGTGAITDPFTLSVPQGVTYAAVFAVPEPGTLALMLVGLGGLGFAARRRVPNP
jgi:hypothetical protein